MNHKEGVFNSIDNLELYYQCWIPGCLPGCLPDCFLEDEPNAVFLIVHGLGEHCGRYMNIVNHFVPKGYAVYGFDHPGHGKSKGTRVFINSFNDFISNIKLFFDKIRKWHPQKKVFLVGHSMGGLITAAYLLKHQTELGGAVISAPAVKTPDDLSKFTLFTASILSKILPKIGVQQLDAKGVSSDPEVVKAYIDDPLVCNKKITARLAVEILNAMEIVSMNAGKITLPVIILQGGSDSIVDPNGARMLYDKASSKDKTIHVYEGFFHEIFNEPDRLKVFNDVETWLEAHV